TVVGSGAATLGLAWRAVLLTVAVALGGCAALPGRVERPASHALDDVAGTALAKIAAASTPPGGDDAGPGASGFRLLADIADAYFDRGGDANFIDLDVLASGPVVARLAAVFDAFWNSPAAYPVGSLARGPGAGSGDDIAPSPVPGLEAAGAAEDVPVAAAE